MDRTMSKINVIDKRNQTGDTAMDTQIQKTGDDLVVIADNPQEMVEAQNATIGIIAAKLDRAGSELADAMETQKHLADAGMVTGAAERMVKQAELRIEFLGKV